MRFIGRWVLRLRGSRASALTADLEAPVPDEVVSPGRLVVFGWAFDRKKPVLAVLVSIDGEMRAVAQVGEPRPDIAARFPGELAAGRSGWGVHVPLQGAGKRWIEVSAIVVRDGAAPTTIDTVRIRFVADKFVGNIDRPEPGEVLPREPVPLAGWALPPGGPLARVEVSLNGRPSGLARPGVSRPDLALGWGHVSEATLSGFEDLLDLRSLPPDVERAQIGVVAVGLDGKRFDLPPVQVRVKPPRPDPPPGLLPPRPAGKPGEPIRLLAVTHDLGQGGGQLYLFELLRRLPCAPEISCTVVAPRHGSLVRPLEELGIDVHLCGDYPIEWSDEYEAHMQRLVAWAKPHDFNVAIINTMGAFPGQDLASRLSIPSLWAIHESVDPDAFWPAAYAPPGPDQAIRRVALAGLSAASALVFEADATRRLYEPFVRDPERLITIPYGVDLEEIGRFRTGFDRVEARERLGLPADAFVLLCMGTIEPRKAQGMLVEAFAQVAGSHPDVFLALVGARGDQHSESVERYVESVGLGQKVKLVSVVTDHYEWYGVADALLIPSDLESMPRSVIEAMAFEIPVMAADVFGLPELITDGETGFLHSPRDLEVLIAALDRLLSQDPEALARVGKNGARLVHERHDSRHYAGEYRTLLQALIADPAVHPADVLS